MPAGDTLERGDGGNVVYDGNVWYARLAVGLVHVFSQLGRLRVVPEPDKCIPEPRLRLWILRQGAT